MHGNIGDRRDNSKGKQATRQTGRKSSPDFGFDIKLQPKQGVNGLFWEWGLALWLGIAHNARAPD